jgi:predicted amidohydrolase
MTTFAIGGIQMQIYAHRNIDQMKHRMDLMMHLYPWVQMVLFSELAPFGPLLPHAQPLPGPAEEAFQEMAQRHGIWVIPGSMLEKRDGAIYNTTPIIDPSGEVIARYRKIFPFAPLEEGVESGDEFVVFDVAGVGRIGLSNCYDMWFPETSRTLTAMGAEVILHPVLTHTPDRDVDLAIARATAAMFQCYVFDVNGLVAGGTGRSAVFDPNGRVLFQADTVEQMMPISLDFEMVRRERRQGLRGGLGQPLKSFRDRSIDFTVYDRESWDESYLQTLGPLERQHRGVVPGLAGAPITVRAKARELA